jgi:hypothetical protein
VVKKVKGQKSAENFRGCEIKSDVVASLVWSEGVINGTGYSEIATPEEVIIG